LRFGRPIKIKIYFYVHRLTNNTPVSNLKRLDFYDRGVYGQWRIFRFRNHYIFPLDSGWVFFNYNLPVYLPKKDTMSNQEAKTEKRSSALSSVIYAVFLTTFKLIVGLLTNSLGILAEAAHSGLDLVAAATTYFAVRASDKPADKEHPFGHGKI